MPDTTTQNFPIYLLLQWVSIYFLSTKKLFAQISSFLSIGDSSFWSTWICPGRSGYIYMKRLDQFVTFIDVYSYENWNYINFIPWFSLKILEIKGQNLFGRWPGKLNYTHLKKTNLLLPLIMPTSKPKFKVTSQLVLEMLDYK